MLRRWLSARRAVVPFELMWPSGVFCTRSKTMELLSRLLRDTSHNKTTHQYVLDLRERIERSCKMAQEELVETEMKNKKRYFDKKAKLRVLVNSDKVVTDRVVRQCALLDNVRQLDYLSLHQTICVAHT